MELPTEHTPEIEIIEKEDISVGLLSKVILYNDEWHSFDEVIMQIIKAIGTLNLVANKDRRRGKYYRNYIIRHLEIRTYEDHNFASVNPNLDDWIEELIDRLNEARESEE